MLDPKGFGRVRLAVIPDASMPVLRGFLLVNVEPDSTVVTDDWQTYRKTVGDDFAHHPITKSLAGVDGEVHRLLGLRVRARRI